MDNLIGSQKIEPNPGCNTGGLVSVTYRESQNSLPPPLVAKNHHQAMNMTKPNSFGVDTTKTSKKSRKSKSKKDNGLNRRTSVEFTGF